VTDDIPISDDAPWPEQRFVSVDDFRRVPFNERLHGVHAVYDSTLETVLMTAAREHRSQEPAFSVYRLLASICGMHFRLHDKSGTFGAKLIWDGRRSAIPEDFVGEQSDVFAEILGLVEHPALRARLADVTWTNDRKKGQAARIAIEAYCECVEGLLAGIFGDRFASENAVSLEKIDLVERAVQLHERSGKSGSPLPERSIGLLAKLYVEAREHIDVFPLTRLAGIRYRHSLISADDLAEDLETTAVAAAAGENPYPLAIKELWDFAASVHEDAGRPEEQRRCRLEAVEQTLKMAIQNNSASAQAHWYRQAIAELRTIPHTDVRREELHREMRRLQEKSLEEMGTFSTPFDFKEIAEHTEETFAQLTLPDAIWEFAVLAIPSDVDKLRREALEGRGGLADLFSSTHLDHEGKVVAEIEGAALGEPSEEWIKAKMIQNQSYTIRIAVQAQMEPARRIIAAGFPISERHFRFITKQSPFVPRSHAESFALGFARLFQGDLLSAGHLLIPQLEHCLRHVLVSSGTDPSKMLNDLTQEDRSLSALLELHREDMDRIFGKSMVLHMDLVFNARPGPALRHEFAHGKVGDAAYGSASVYYACCILLLLTCIALRPVWKEHVTPAMERGVF
jgi:hypothetical protein